MQYSVLTHEHAGGDVTVGNGACVGVALVSGSLAHLMWNSLCD